MSTIGPFSTPALTACLLALGAILVPLPSVAQALPAGCEVKELATVPLQFTRNMLPIAEASLNGTPIPALLDLGAQHATPINKKTLERLGINVRSSETNYPGVFVMHALIDQFSLGPTEHKNSWFPVEDLKSDVIGAKIGANYLLRTDLEIALEAGYLKYFKPTGCYRAKLAYWDQKAASVATRNDPRRRDLRPWFKVRINGKDVDTVLSTANEHSYLDQFTAARMGLTPESPGATREDPVTGWNERRQPVWSVPVASMTIGDLDVKDFSLRLMNLDLSGEMLVLGTDFLRRHRVYIAMSQNRIYFTPVDAAPVPQRPPTTLYTEAAPADSGRDQAP